jgi:hypothetical protein
MYYEKLIIYLNCVEFIKNLLIMYYKYSQVGGGGGNAGMEQKAVASASWVQNPYPRKEKF